MEVIPVIDLMQGQVVRARRGERHLYRPIESGLCRGSAPLDIVRALLELYPFKQLYIADLDAIMERGNHLTTISGIRDQFPTLELWLDAGVHLPEHVRTLASLDPHLVIGTEKLASIHAFNQIAELLTPEKTILSLDFSPTGFLGPAELLDNAGRWPHRVIAMTLAQVGSMQGADIAQLSVLRERAPRNAIYAAGGIRNSDDLSMLSNAGIKGALVASALHDGTLGHAHLSRL